MRRLGKIGLALAFGAGALALGASASARDAARVSFAIHVSDGAYESRYDPVRYDRRDGRRDRYDYDRRHGRDGRGRVVKTRIIGTRYRARIVLVEALVPGRHGANRVCTVDVRGPEARYVPRVHVRHIAYAECSRFSRIRFV